ncbi:MAG: dihydrolipoamide acetyltransferase family protein [Eubacteriales bacterium]
MANAVIMPRQGQSVESCIITAWHKKAGDKVAVGDVLFSYETDKSAFDEKSEVEGTLLKVLFAEGDDVPCLETVCYIGNEGETVADEVKASSEAKAEERSEAKPDPAEEKPSASVAVPERTEGERVKISPRAKNLALKTGADLSHAGATGPNGRIIERDVVAALDAGYTVPTAKVEDFLAGKFKAEEKAAPAEAPAAAASAQTAASVSEAEYEDVKLPQIRKVIARSMQASLQECAQLTLNASFDATQIMAFRAAMKANGEAMGMGNITINDMILFAVAKTLPAHKSLNAHFLGENMRFFKNVNLGIAVDTERGLMVPTVSAAEKLSLSELAKASKAVITEAQSGTISPDKLKGASFTVSNLGAMGIESFTPVINPPQTGILGVCSLTKRVKEVNGAPVFYPCIPLSLTFDHRALDGAPAARFLKELCTNLENFNLLLAK